MYIVRGRVRMALPKRMRFPLVAIASQLALDQIEIVRAATRSRAGALASAINCKIFSKIIHCMLALAS